MAVHGAQVDSLDNNMIKRSLKNSAFLLHFQILSPYLQCSNSWLSSFSTPTGQTAICPNTNLGFFYAHRFAPDINVASKFIYEQEDIA